MLPAPPVINILENIKIFIIEMIIDQKKLLIDAKGNVKIYDNTKGILIVTDAITYDKGNNVLKSINKSTLTDKIGNVFYVDNFILEINNDLLKLKMQNLRTDIMNLIQHWHT